MSQDQLGVTLDSVKKSSPLQGSKANAVKNDIAVYVKDAKKSLIIGGIAILLEVALYFSGVIK